MVGPDRLARVEPHPVLPAYYQRPDQRPGFIRDLFNETAPYYDWIDNVFSLGSGTRYRRECLAAAGIRPGLRVADIAIGTGLVAREAIAITGSESSVIGLDASEGMLAIARSKLGIPLIQGIAEQMPLADSSVDFVTMGYALRHVSDLVLAFREFHRVLRPGGTVLVLEIGRPTKLLTRALMATYLGGLVPLICRWAARHSPAPLLMRYYWETIEQCVPPPTIMNAMRDSGFAKIDCKTDLDVFRSYIGRKP